MTLEAPEPQTALFVRMHELIERIEATKREVDITVVRRARTWRGVMIIRTATDLEVCKREFNAPELQTTLTCIVAALENL